MREKAKLEHEELLQKVRTEATTSNKRICAERDGIHSRYHGVLRSGWGTGMSPDERIAGHPNMLPKLQLLFKKRRKVNAIL